MINFIAAVAFPIVMAAAAPSQVATSSAPLDSSVMTLLVVQNDRSVAVTVYAQDELSELKLGVVEPYGMATFEVAPYMVAEGEVQFFVHPAGQVDEASQPLELTRGERVGLVVPPR